ncbi:MAG TPA: hypothetical protein VK745_17375 [Polyangiaceae bacterium]|jgi:hypothetical protein|nr:hypothetical protein [Polyangiaceae bacterium]
MKKTTLLATVLLLGASATGIGAATGGNLQGSDTLKDMTKAILDSCVGATGLNYVGGGSGTGQTAMVNGTQEIAPMSSPIAATTQTCTTTANHVDLTKSQLRVVAYDGLAITTSLAQTNACSGSANPTLANGTGTADGFDVFPHDANGNVTGPATSHYQLAPAQGAAGASGAWKDILKIIYFGMDNTVANSSVDFSTQKCNGDVRRSLVDNFGALFKGGCTTPGKCTALQHAFRRDDQSGTTDTFIKLLGAYAYPGVAVQTNAGTGTDNGTTNNCPGSADPPIAGGSGACGFQHAAAPFCNGRELEDRDPIRRACSTPVCTTDADCQPTGVKCVKASSSATTGLCYGDQREDAVCSLDGKLGLVLPIFSPPEPDYLPATGPTDNSPDPQTVDALYTVPACPTTNKVALLNCAKFTDYKTQAIVFQCPDRPIENGANIAGGTFTPVTATGLPCQCTGDPNSCKSVLLPAGADHRVFNLFVRRQEPTGTVVNNAPSGTPAGKSPAAAQILTAAPRDANRVLGLGAPNYPPSALPTGVTSPFPAGFDVSRFYPIINAYWRLRGSPAKPAAARCALDVSATACTTDADCGADQSEGARCVSATTGIQGGPGFCTRPNSDTRNIGCLAATVDCSIGYAGKESQTITANTTSFSVGDANGIVLTNATALDLSYPLARRLFLNSYKGFQGCLAGNCTNIADPLEKAFAASSAGATATAGCYGDNLRVQTVAASPAIAFVASPQLDCIDFNEQACNGLAYCTANTDCKANGSATQGTCSGGSCTCTANSDCPGGRTCVSGSCTFASNSHSCCGDGVITNFAASTVSGAQSAPDETCDPPTPGNPGTSGSCDPNCHLVP